VGGRLIGGNARQHPDLNEGPVPATRSVVLGLLAFDGVLSAVAGVLLLPIYVGTIPLPISAIVCGLLNVALVWAALQCTTRPRLAALPLWTFLVTLLLLTFGGPGGDIMFDGLTSAAVMILFGAAPPTYLLWWRTNRPPSRGG
jgi:hypothetical protein